MADTENQDEHKYDDIINEEWPRLSSRSRMTLNNRAKIFLPFAALTGFEAEIEKRRIRNEELINNTEGSTKFEEE